MNDRQETNAVIEIMKGNNNPVADFFSSPPNTTETDDQPIINAINDNGYQVPCVDADFARKLERERDEAREHLREIKEYGTEEINTAVELRQKLAQTLIERDEAREALRSVLELANDIPDEALDAWKNYFHTTLEAAK